MTTFLMGRKEVEYVREARHGDKGFNPAKPRMVLINVPGEGQRVIPFASLKVIKDGQSDELVERPAGKKRGRR